MLIVEVLSPSTASHDRQIKVPDYCRIPSVAEIVLVDSESVFAEILRRDGRHWMIEIVQGPSATLSLLSIGMSVAMSELYRGIEVAPDRSARREL